MLEINFRQLDLIGKHLKKVTEVYELNQVGGTFLKIPDEIWLYNYQNGQPLGTIKWSEDEGEHVFVPYESKPPTLRDTSHIPIPPPFASS